jgi:hypothetical protein
VRTLWLFVVAALVLAGCQAGHQARADSIDAGLEQAFTLAGGQHATITGEPLRLRFTEVLEDSRCPTKVQCFWTGQARITVTVEHGQDAPATVEFNTNPAPDQNRQTVHTGEYEITLRALDPYPQTPEDATPLPDYRATLVVRRTD